MDDKTNIYLLLNTIDKFYILLPKISYFSLPFLNQKSDIFSENSSDEIEVILKELEQAGVLIIEKPSKLLQVGKGLFYKKYFDYRYGKGSNFDVYYKDLKNDLGIDLDIELNIDLDKPEYVVSYDEFSGIITIKQFSTGNSIDLIKPRDDSQNQVVFEYVFKSPMVTFSKSFLEGEFRKRTKCNGSIDNLDRIVKNIGFTKDLRTAFFKVSKDKIMFRKEITTKDLLSSKINLIHYFQ